jgi:Pyridoxamine 5'-phosphate oxidase
MDPALKQEIVSILDEANDLTIATVREDGYPQATTVSYVNDGRKIYFGCAAASQKAQNLARCAVRAGSAGGDSPVPGYARDYFGSRLPQGVWPQRSRQGRQLKGSGPEVLEQAF